MKMMIAVDGSEFAEWSVQVLEAVASRPPDSVTLVHVVDSAPLKTAARKHVAAFDMNIALGALPSLLFLLFFHREKHFDINNLVKVAGDSIKLGRDVTTQGWGNFEVMTADRQVRKRNLRGFFGTLNL